MYLKLNFNDDLQSLSRNPEKIQESRAKENPHQLTIKEKMFTRSKSKNFEGRKKAREDDSSKKASKSIKKESDEDYFSSSSESPNSMRSFPGERMLDFHEENRSFDIVMMGNLQYRYNLDQIELEGTWGISNDTARERFSYLFLKKKDKITCSIKKDEIEFSEMSEVTQVDDELVVNVCTANLFEVVVIPHPTIFRVLLQFLSGEYHGFFMYYDKTIEDRFMLNFCLEEAQVRISGEGSNNLGNFNLIGYLNFYRTKDDIMMRNDIESEVILLGEFKMSKIYNAFNPNENFRVIKSYQHKKKKFNDEGSNN